MNNILLDKQEIDKWVGKIAIFNTSYSEPAVVQIIGVNKFNQFIGQVLNKKENKQYAYLHQIIEYNFDDYQSLYLNYEEMKLIERKNVINSIRKLKDGIINNTRDIIQKGDNDD